MKWFRKILRPLAWVGVGVVIGGFLFSKTRPRSFLAVRECENCMTPQDVGGLVASIGMQRFLPLIPGAVMETDKTLVIRHPMSHRLVHFVLIPKRDIKNAADISEEDAEYLIDIYRVMRKLVKDNGLNEYRFYTNGPGHQTVTYIHFHLIAD